jgi:hypothetical protein
MNGRKASQNTTRLNDDLVKLLTRYREELKDSNPLLFVLTQGNDWARHYNGLIWQIGSVILPFAFAGLALDFHNDKGNLKLLQLLTVASASIFLLILWFGLSEWLRNSRIHVTSVTDFIVTNLEESLRPALNASEKPERLLRVAFLAFDKNFRDRDPPSHFGSRLPGPDRGLKIRCYIYICAIGIWAVRVVAEILFTLVGQKGFTF